MIEKRGVMADMAGSHRVVDPVGKTGYELAFEDTFDGDALDQARWLPHYLPQWSSHEAAAARYKLGDGVLRLLIEADQQPWCREFDGQTRVSSLRSEEHTSELQSRPHLVCRLLLEKKKTKKT